MESVHARYLSTTSPPFWSLTAVLADLVAGQPYTFPTPKVGDPEGALLVFYDANGDQASSWPIGGTSGSITFQQFDCNGSLEFSIDAVLGALQVGTGPIKVTGRFDAPFGPPPEGWD